MPSIEGGVEDKDDLTSKTTMSQSRMVRVEAEAEDRDEAVRRAKMRVDSLLDKLTTILGRLCPLTLRPRT